MADPTSTSTSTAAPASTSAPVSTSTTSEPVTTSSIAADVIADLEGDGSDDGGTPPAAPVVAAATPPVADPVADPDDIDALHESTVDALGRKRTNSIPVTRVKEMRTKSEQKLLASIAKELGLTPAEGAALKLDDIIATVKEHGTKRTGYETKLQQVDAVEKLIASDPDKFMEIITGINPAYKAYAKAVAAGTTPATPAVAEDPEPQPDYPLDDKGNMTYSLKGLKDLRAWERRQAIKEVNAGLDTRLKPVEERLKADTEREAYSKWHSEATARVNERLEKARKWPKFTDNEPAILKAMQADQSVSLEDAYMQVVVPSLAGDRTKIRQEVLAEIEKQPKTSSVAVSPAVTKPADNKPKSTADIAREVMASMEG